MQSPHSRQSRALPTVTLNGLSEILCYLVSTNLLLALQVASASYEELEYGQTWSRAMGQLASTPAKPTMQY